MSECRFTYADANGVRRTIVFDEEKPDSFGVFTEQNLDEVLASVERDRDMMTHGVNKVVARIPVTIYERAIGEKWDEMDWKRWLNSSEAAPFRIWRGDV